MGHRRPRKPRKGRASEQSITRRGLCIYQKLPIRSSSGVFCLLNTSRYPSSTDPSRAAVTAQSKNLST